MDPLLSTKTVIPPVRARLIERPRLTVCLDLGQRRRLTLISAPAGYGKTTLLSAWARHVTMRVAWLSLDEWDTDPVRFTAYLIAAIERCVGSLGVDIPASPKEALTASLRQTITALINSVNRLNTNLVLVLDDYHLAAAPETDHLMAFLLDHLPPNLHIYLATRADPALPLARFRGRNDLMELRAADLRFTPDEALVFLGEVIGTDLDQHDVARLVQRTEGWAAGLQLAALSMQGRPDLPSFVAAFTGGHHYIMDYLLAEVLERQPPEIQSFLLETSILNTLSAPLCDTVRETEGDARTVLEMLERANLFVVALDDHREWFRYHRLFADLLQQRLGRLNPGRLPELHRRAANWYQSHAMPSEAIEHALAAGEPSRAARLVADAAEIVLARSELATFRRWIEALPENEVCRHPELCIYQAWSLLWSGHPLGEIEHWLSRLGRLNEQQQGQVAGLRALLALYRTDMDQVAVQSKVALAQLGTDDVLFRGMAVAAQAFARLDEDAGTGVSEFVRKVIQETAGTGNILAAVITQCALGEMCVRQGLLEDGREMYQQALDHAVDEQGTLFPVAGQALIGLGTVAFLQNELDEADAYLSKGIDLAHDAGQMVVLDGLIGLSRLCQARGDYARASTVLAEALQLARQFDATEVDDWLVEMERARAWVVEGDLDAAERWMQTQTILSESGDANLEDRAKRLQKYLRVIEARLRLAQDRPAEALNALEEAQAPIEARGRTTALIELLVLKAQAHERLEDRAQALVALERALSLAAPHGHLRVFVDAGADLIPLLREVALLSGTAFAQRVLAAFDADAGTTVQRSHVPSGARPAGLIEPLSERETEVLALLPTHLTSTEIADRLYISPSTARTHIKHIYAKLGVHSRDEAIVRAQKMGLL